MGRGSRHCTFTIYGPNQSDEIVYLIIIDISLMTSERNQRALQVKKKVVSINESKPYSE